MIEAYRGPGVSLLEVEDLRAAYGEVRVLEGIDFSVDEGGRWPMLGPNGAGKTTVLRALSGMVRTSGRADFDGQPARQGDRGHRPARHGSRARGARHVPALTVTRTSSSARTPERDAAACARTSTAATGGSRG